MTTITAQCAKCGAPMHLEREIDPDLWPALSKLLLCSSCAPKPDPVKPTPSQYRPGQARAGIRSPMADP
jgi:hypothetical protein